MLLHTSCIDCTQDTKIIPLFRGYLTQCKDCPSYHLDYITIHLSGVVCQRKLWLFQYQYYCSSTLQCLWAGKKYSDIIKYVSAIKDCYVGCNIAFNPCPIFFPSRESDDLKGFTVHTHAEAPAMRFGRSGPLDHESLSGSYT